MSDAVRNSWPFTLSLVSSLFLQISNQIVEMGLRLLQKIFLIMVLTSTISMFQNHRKDELDCVNCCSSSKFPLEEFAPDLKET